MSSRLISTSNETFFSSSIGLRFYSCFFAMFEFLVNIMDLKKSMCFHLYLYTTLGYMVENMSKEDIEKYIKFQYFELLKDVIA